MFQKENLINTRKMIAIYFLPFRSKRVNKIEDEYFFVLFQIKFIYLLNSSIHRREKSNEIFVCMSISSWRHCRKKMARYGLSEYQSVIGSLLWEPKAIEHSIDCSRGSFTQFHKLIQNQNINLRTSVMFLNSVGILKLSYGCKIHSENF